MSNQEILEQAIQKAIDSGYELVKNPDWLWKVGEGTATGLCIHIVPDEKKVGLITYISYPINYERIIFNHDFAKALWGGCKFCNPSAGRFTKDHPNHWQSILQQMVIAGNPIKYLGENI